FEYFFAPAFASLRLCVSRSLSRSMGVAVLLGGFLLVPLEVLIRQRAAELVEPGLVVHHLLPRVAAHGILVLQEDRLLGAHLLAHAAVDAAEHVDLEFPRRLLDVIGRRARRNLARRDPNRLRRTDEFTKLTRDALLAAVRILHQGRHAAITRRN